MVVVLLFGRVNYKMEVVMVFMHNW